jgi:5-methylcytosine-specific restriction endonuclease McrA
MWKLIPELISLLVPSTKKKERNNFTAKVKKETILKQKGKCAICRDRLNRWERDFHHKDGNKSNHNLSNCRAVHTRCHRKKHAEAYDKNDKSWSNWRIRAWIP